MLLCMENLKKNTKESNINSEKYDQRWKIPFLVHKSTNNKQGENLNNSINFGFEWGK